MEKELKGYGSLGDNWIDVEFKTAILNENKAKYPWLNEQSAGLIYRSAYVESLKGDKEDIINIVDDYLILIHSVMQTVEE